MSTIDRNKIARNLTPEELHQFVAQCGQEKDLSLARVQALASEWGISVSLMGAKSFRDVTFDRYLEELRRKREMAELVSVSAQNGLALSDGAASVLMQKIFDELLSGEDHDIEAMNNLSLALSRLRMGDQRGKALDLRIEQQQFDAAKAVVEHLSEFSAIVADRGLNTEAKVAAVRDRLWGPPPEKGADS